MTTMTAMFDHSADAERARQKLLAIGVPSSCIRITGNTETLPASQEKGFWQSLGEMFGDDSETYAEGIRRGGYLITVTDLDDSLHNQALDILDDEGTIDLDERSESWRAEGWSGTDRTTAAASTGAVPTGSVPTETVIPVVEEQLKVGKREVKRGKARVRSYVTERPVEEGVTLRTQHVEVEQRSADRPATAADLAAQDKTVEVEAVDQEAVVEKQARVVGEVVVKTDETAREETVTDTVKKTKVEVDKGDNDDRRGGKRD